MIFARGACFALGWILLAHGAPTNSPNSKSEVSPSDHLQMKRGRIFDETKWTSYYHPRETMAMQMNMEMSELDFFQASRTMNQVNLPDCYLDAIEIYRERMVRALRIAKAADWNKIKKTVADIEEELVKPVPARYSKAVAWAYRQIAFEREVATPLPTEIYYEPSVEDESSLEETVVDSSDSGAIEHSQLEVGIDE